MIIDGESRHVISYMKDFLFKPEQARTPVKALSGGERGRLMLARALARPSNLLVLDEPTNDLDLETLDLLQEMLAGYPGTLLLVSHDRDFLDRTVTSVIAFEGDGQMDRICRRLFRHGGAARPRRARAPQGKPAAPSPARRAPEARRGPDPRKRLSFADQHALKTSPARIEALNEEIRRLEHLLADPDFYARDRAGFAAAGAELAKAQRELAAAEEEWLRLELLREEIQRPGGLEPMSS